MFDRTANLANNQIINYRCDPSEKWLVLIGIAPGSPDVRSSSSQVLDAVNYQVILFVIILQLSSLGSSRCHAAIK